MMHELPAEGEPLKTVPMKPFLRTVCALRSLWEEGDQSAHTRIFDILIRDKYVDRYESIEYLARKGSFKKGETRREHAVSLQNNPRSLSQVIWARRAE